MHDCRACGQHLTAFAFYCPRCGAAVGRVVPDGDLISVVWTDAAGRPVARRQLKTLKLGDDYLNVSRIEPPAPAAGTRAFTLTTKDGRRVRQSALEFYAQAAGPTQEWIVSPEQISRPALKSLPLFAAEAGAVDEEL